MGLTAFRELYQPGQSEAAVSAGVEAAIREGGVGFEGAGYARGAGGRIGLTGHGNFLRRAWFTGNLAAKTGWYCAAVSLHNVRCTF